jgi:D-alanyl-D-alanine endopeptidase (penicillin-binding protein 7)
VLTRSELLLLALMSSENRAAFSLARTYPGGTDAFVAAMNAKARALGMNDTRFIDPDRPVLGQRLHRAGPRAHGARRA